MELRETSYRRINRVLHDPAVESPLGMTGHDVLVDPDIHYLRCGEGLVIYIVRGAVANMHGALMPGDGKKAGKVWPQHLAYLRRLGVRKVTARIRDDHVRAAIMCRALGFKAIESEPGFKRYAYEVMDG